MQIAPDIDAIAPEDLEWVEWTAQAGTLELATGRLVRVGYGDTLLMWITDAGCSFLDHKPVTRH